jgi:vacuolar-type H+-ATPase subunit D/Vma8
MTKIKDEQLTKIREQQTKLNELLNQMGYLEAQKHGLLHEFANVNKEVEDYKKELEAEYGQVSINLETGEYTELNKDEQ